MENQEVDLIRRSIRDLVMETIIPIEVLGEISDTIKGYNVSTFLLDASIGKLLERLTNSAYMQDSVFDLLVEFRYRLLAMGVNDNDITALVKNSLDTIFMSNSIPGDYKNKIARIPDDNKSDILLQLLYLLRVNIVYMDNMIITRKNTTKE